MKILLLDDVPDIMRLYADRLQREEALVVKRPSMTGALRAIEQANADGTPFDLVVIDLMLNRMELEFTVEEKKLASASAQRQSPNIPSGQALGLRLWNMSQRRPYCYLSSHPGLWVPGVDREFEDATETELDLLRLHKDRVRSAELKTKLNQVIDLWRQKGWCKSC